MYARRPLTSTRSTDGLIVVPSAVTGWPLTVMAPALIMSSACRRDETPACARNFCKRVATLLRRLRRGLVTRGCGRRIRRPRRSRGRAGRLVELGEQRVLLLGILVGQRRGRRHHARRGRTTFGGPR